MQVIYTILSVIYILFLPGFFLSFVFFKGRQIDLLERIALSFALSIAIVPLIIFYGNLMGVAITTISVILYVASIIFLTGIILFILNRRNTT